MLWGERFMAKSFVPYESIVHLFSHIQPLIFMTICAPIRNNLLLFLLASIKMFLVPLFFKASGNAKRGQQGSEKKGYRSLVLSRLLVALSFVFVLLSINFVVLSPFQIHKLTSRHEYRSLLVKSQQASNFSNYYFFRGISIVDERFECLESRGYPNTQFHKCYTVIASPYQNES